MGEDDVRINTVCTRVKLAINEGDFLFLFWVQELLVVGFDFGVVLVGTPGGRAVAIVLPWFGFGIGFGWRGVVV